MTEPSELNLRPARASDAERVFAWANDPLTRQASFSTAEITWDEHLAWFAAQLERGDRNPLIAERDGEALAFLRLDARSDVAGVCTISINVAPLARGQGVGVRSLQAASRVARELGFSSIHALIRPENQASRAAFERAGYLAEPQLESGTEPESGGQRARVYVRHLGAD